MKITLDTKTVESITRILGSVSENHELEFRLGVFRPDGRFSSGVKRHQFDTLFNTLKKSGSSYKKVESKVTYYRDSDIRRIEEGGTTTFQYKRKDEDVNIPFSSIGVRFSSAIEKRVDPISGGIVSAVRLRERHTFSFDTCDIELSKIKSSFLPGSKNVSGDTYEVEAEFTKRIRTVQEFVVPLKKILETLFPERFYMIPDDDAEVIKQEWKKIHTTVFKPKNIKRKDIQTMKDYSVTNKLNGVGYQMFISGKGIHILNSTNIDKLSSSVLSSFTGTILDGEWDFESGQWGYHIFNCLAYKGTDTSMIPHNEQISMLKDIVPELQRVLKEICTVEVKNFFSSGDLANDTKSVMRYIYNRYGEHALEKNDGIMFTPMRGTPLKFKFPSTMTIDFEITDEKILGNGSKSYTIRVYTYNDKLVPFDGKHQYRTKETVDLKVNPKMIVEKNDPLFDQLSNGLVVECLYSKEENYFTPERIRWDKKLPNFIEVAIDVFKDIIHPIKLEEMVSMFEHDSTFKAASGEAASSSSSSPGIKKGECLIPMRKFHNRKKDQLISKYAQNEEVLDLGFGRGGDFLKYSNAGVKFIWGIDPNEENLEEAKRRYKDPKNKFKMGVKFIHGKAQDTRDISEKMDYKKVGIVASFFSLTFFFEREQELDALINTIVANIKMGGHFIGTTMSGDDAYKTLKGKTEIDHPGCYKIVKHYDDDDVQELGKRITIHLEETIVTEQEEYLVFFDIFKERMEKRGFVLVEQSFFDPPKDLNKATYELSKLNMSFVFKRVETAEDIRLKEKELVVKERAKAEKERLEKEEENELPMAKMDKNLVFKVGYLDYLLVRTGTVGDGSCFFHSVLKSVSPDYSKLDEEERRNLVKGLREKMADQLTMSKWESFGKGILAYSRLIPRFVKYIRLNVPELLEIAQNLELSNDISTIEDYFLHLKEIVPDKIEKRAISIFSQLRKRVFDEFKVDLTKCSTWVGQEMGSVDVFEYISDYLNIDIYLIKDTTRMPYRQAVDCNIRYKNRESVIVLWVGDSHYETVGVNMGKGKIKRVFKPDDDIVVVTKAIVCPPKK